MNDERIAAVRDGCYQEGICLTLYLDLPAGVIEEWEDKEAWDVGALDREASLTFVRMLNGLTDDQLDVLRDEASRAVSILAGLGTDRQAFLAGIIEATLYTKPRPGKPDLLQGLNDDSSRDAQEVERAMRRLAHEQDNAFARLYRQVRADEAREHSDAEAAVAEAARLLFGRQDADGAA